MCAIYGKMHRNVISLNIDMMGVNVLYFLSTPFNADTSADKAEASETRAATDFKDTGESKRKYREMIFGEEALKISSKEPYCVHRPIRRGHFNVSPHYSAQQVYNIYI